MAGFLFLAFTFSFQLLALVRVVRGVRAVRG
jgi:hypothetical protein